MKRKELERDTVQFIIAGRRLIRELKRERDRLFKPIVCWLSKKLERIGIK
jgi:hypothetical protein